MLELYKGFISDALATRCFTAFSMTSSIKEVSFSLKIEATKLLYQLICLVNRHYYLCKCLGSLICTSIICTSAYLHICTSITSSPVLQSLTGSCFCLLLLLMLLIVVNGTVFGVLLRPVLLVFRGKTYYMF
jgi:hypothetical protein